MCELAVGMIEPHWTESLLIGCMKLGPRMDRTEQVVRRGEKGGSIDTKTRPAWGHRTEQSYGSSTVWAQGGNDSCCLGWSPSGGMPCGVLWPMKHWQPACRLPKLLCSSALPNTFLIVTSVLLLSASFTAQPKIQQYFFKQPLNGTPVSQFFCPPPSKSNLTLSLYFLLGSYM